ncbi:MAG: serine hydrolase [Gemmataceae bacterium]
MLVLLLVALASPPAIALEEDSFGDWLKNLDRAKLQPSAVSVHVLHGKPLFSAVALENRQELQWEVLPNLTPAAFVEQFQKRSGAGQRLMAFLPYVGDAGPRVCAQWVKDDSLAFEARMGMTPQQYQTLLDDKVKAGMRPTYVIGYTEGKSARLGVVFNRMGGTWAAAHAQSLDELRRFVAQRNREGGYRVVHLSAYTQGSEPRFNVVVENDGLRGGYEVELDAKALKRVLTARAKEKAVLEGVWGYTTPKGPRFALFWRQPTLKAKLPIQGVAVPELATLDEVMLQFMREREIEAGSLAISRNGKIVLSRGYGYLDREHRRPLPPDAPFRLASVTKPITAALIHTLVAQGKLKYTDKVMPLIGFTDAVDPRWNQITVQMLLDHKGGWDRNVKPLYDPMFQEMLICKTLRLDGPPSPRDFIRFMSRRKLDFDPGSKTVYSNFGYCVLGRVIEKVSGQPYVQAAKNLLEPLGITTLSLARTRPKDRDPREPFYYDPRLMPDVVRGLGLVPYPDGGIYFEAQDANGGLVLSAPDLCRFMNAYWLDGTPRKENNGASWTFFGGMAGSFTMARQRPDGIHIAALFNQRVGPEEPKAESIEKRLDAAIERITKWP